MTDRNPTENLDAEGIPDEEEHPPGIDIDLDEEATMAPRDHSVAAGSDPAYAVTPAEERQRESVAARASRENPDTGADEAGAGGPAQAGGNAQPEPGVPLAEPDGGPEAGPAARSVDDPSVAASPEEEAVHVRDDSSAG